MAQVDISFEGLNDDEQSNAKGFLKLDKHISKPGFNENVLSNLQHQAIDDIKRALRPFGYYQSQVSSEIKKIKDNHWQVHYKVDKGARVTVASVHLTVQGEGADTAEINKVIAQYALKTGDFFIHEHYEKEKDLLLSRIGNLGYVDVKINRKRVLLDPKANTANIELDIDTGKKYYLGEFHFHQDLLAESFIYRYLDDIKPGDRFAPRTLLELQQTLIASGYFAIVDIKPEFDKTEDQNVPIAITLTPAKKHKLQLGLGYDTEIGINASARWINRYLNRYGHNSDVLLKLSSKKSTLRGTYWIPGYQPKTDKFGLTTRLETEQTEDTDRSTLDLEAAWVFKWRKWDSRLFTEYKYEQFEVGIEPATTTQLLSMGGYAEGHFFEQSPYPRSGWGALMELRGAPGAFKSGTYYLRLYFKTRVLFPVGEEGRFITRAELGMADVGDYNQYPSSLRFFAGGDQSVRGYDWKSLGPTDDEDNVIGGRNVITASLEYNHTIIPDWIGAVFVDGGNAYNNATPEKIHYGAGFGLRWLSPVGMIRTDLGWPLNKPGESTQVSDLVWYFGFEAAL